MTHQISGGVSYHDSQVSHVGTQKASHRTTNNIFLHPGHHAGEFDNWMRKIGGLLSIGSEAANLKPLLDLLTAAIEPERVFLYVLPAIEEQQIKACTEILLVVDTKRMAGMESLIGVVKLACMKYQNVVFTFRSSCDVEQGLKGLSWYEMLHCKEDYLVFSNNPYRLKQVEDHHVEWCNNTIFDIFDNRYRTGLRALEVSKSLFEEQHIYQSYVLLINAMEQIYNSIIYTFESKFHVGNKLAELRQRSAIYLPQLFASSSGLEIIESLSEFLVDRVKFSMDELETEFDDVLCIAETFISAVKPCFQSKINYLIGHDGHYE